MAEAGVDNSNDDLLTGLDTGDLTSGVYEGGFKTWECAIDLAEFIAASNLDSDWHIIELGAGSAIPSCVLLNQAIRRDRSESTGRYHFTLCDYNEDVLNLCTAPNVFLNAHHAFHPVDGHPAEENDFDFEAIDAGSVTEQLASRGITIDMISGGWDIEFAELAASSRLGGQRSNIMILASETIYSPDSLRDFNETLLVLLKSAPSSARALVAAKQIYFGVGGGVAEFTRDIHEGGAAVKTVSEISTAGVGRVILEVTLNAKPA